MVSVFGVIMGLGILLSLLLAAFILMIGMLALKLLAFAISTCLGRGRTDFPTEWLRSVRQAGIMALILIAFASFLRVMARTEPQIAPMGKDQLPTIQTIAVDADIDRAVADLRDSSHDIVFTADELAPSSSVPTVDAAPAAQEQGSDTESTQQRRNETAANKTSQPSTPENTTSGSASPSIPDMIEERRKKLAEFAGQIGQLVRSQLESPASVGALSGSTGESSNGDVVVFQLSEEMLRQMLGDSATEMLQTFNAQLPGGIRQTYALIPLSSPVGATVPQVQPLLAASGLSTLADSLVSILNPAESDRDSKAGDMPAGQSAAATEAESQDKPASQEIPEWIGAPRSDQLVAETEALFGDADDQASLDRAVSETVLAAILRSEIDDVQQLRTRAAAVRLQLCPQTVQRCVVKRFVRAETLDTGAEGRKSFRVLYALVEVPEDIQQKIIIAMAGDLRKTRTIELGTSVAGIWLAATFLATGLRCWQSGTRLRRWFAIPLCGLSLPISVAGALVLATLLSGPFARQTSGLVQWEHDPSLIVISE